MKQRGSLPAPMPLSKLLAPYPTAIAEHRGPKPMIDRHNPSGCGIYTMGLQKLPPAAAAAKQAASAGLSFVAILACWQEAESHVASNASRIEEYGAAFREVGLDVGVWGYPHASHERIDQFAVTMREQAKKAGARWILLDPEVSWKGRGPTGGARLMRPLLDRVIDNLDESLGLGFTSFGMAKAHPDFPYEVAGGYGFGSPQFYSVPLAMARKGLEQWRALGWKNHIVASVPTFGENSGPNTAAYAGAIAEHCEGLLFWVWQSTSAEEWRAIEAVSKRYDTATPDRSVA